MRNRRMPTLLLALALLLTQWLSFAHALEHPALAQDKACSVCVLGMNLDGGAPLPASPAVAHWIAPDASSAPLQLHAGVATPLTARARAPPHSTC